MEQTSSRTVESWAREFVGATELTRKLDPGPVPKDWGDNPDPERIGSPGRPPELQIEGKSPKTRGMNSQRNRARLIHTFAHHELQAAELMCWALLAFPETPLEFRQGLLRICLDEVRHLRMYDEYLHSVGYRFGDFPVRDWFWQRVPACASAVEFVAVMGMGFEGANLDHAEGFAGRFRAAGDEAGARVQDLVGAEEVAHVRFAANWFARWTGGCEPEHADFALWQQHLPQPLSPLLMRGKAINASARARAGLSNEFVSALRWWEAETGSSM